MKMTATPIRTSRLDLIPLWPEFLRCSLDGLKEAAEALLGLRVPQEWFASRDMMALRLEQIETDPALQPWLLRAVACREEKSMVGYVGFHTGPEPEYLKEVCPGAIELGYTIFPEFQRRGFAYEAVLGLIDWARGTHGVKDFVVSINPGNEASRRLAARLGFQKVGRHMDKVDGPEDTFRLSL